MNPIVFALLVTVNATLPNGQDQVQVNVGGYYKSWAECVQHMPAMEEDAAAGLLLPSNTRGRILKMACERQERVKLNS